MVFEHYRCTASGAAGAPGTDATDAGSGDSAWVTISERNLSIRRFPKPSIVLRYSVVFLNIKSQYISIFIHGHHRS